MKKLTDYQKEFILEYFFKNEIYAGWKNIAETLLDSGECIVAGDECIWRGGIGNFITTTKNMTAIGCLNYKFNLDEFLVSEHFKEILFLHHSELHEEMGKFEKKLREIDEKSGQLIQLIKFK